MGYSLPNSLGNELKKKRLIFTVTTGRSGTGYLATLLNLMPGVTSCHEEEPRFSEALRRIQQDENAAYHFLMEKKLPQIANEKKRVYVETSHLFCKGFVEPFLELGLTADLIILTRPHREIATSMYKLETIPGRTAKALKYYLSPSDPNVLALPDWQKLDDYQLCYWYCLEIERRCHVYEKEFLRRNCRVARTSLAELSTYRGVYRLLKALDLSRLNPVFWKRYYRNKNKRVNVKMEKKVTRTLPGNIDELEKEVVELVKTGR